MTVRVRFDQRRRPAVCRLKRSASRRRPTTTDGRTETLTNYSFALLQRTRALDLRPQHGSGAIEESCYRDTLFPPVVPEGLR